MLKKIRGFIHSETEAGAYFGNFIQFLIIISILNFSIQTLPNLKNEFLVILNVIEVSSIIIFTIEYLLRRVTSPKPFKFIFSFFGLIDLIAILPFYISLGVDLKSLRAIRLFRLLRLLKFLRYHNTLTNLKQSFDDFKRKLFLFSFATVLLIYFSSVGIYFFENEAQPDAFSSISEALWWSVATLTTVGYGDIYSITIGGKIFFTVIVSIGLGLVTIPTGLVASSLTKALMKSKD